MVTPMTRFTHLGISLLGPVVGTKVPSEVQSGPDWVSRRVEAYGVAEVAWQQIGVGRHRAGRNFDVQISKEILQIWDGTELLETALRDKLGR